MPRFKTKPKYIDAVKFTGENGLEIQNIAGQHFLDVDSKYPVPNFDYATTWIPAPPDGVVAVLWTGWQWLPVSVGDWLYREADGTMGVIQETQLEERYDPA